MISDMYLSYTFKSFTKQYYLERCFNLHFQKIVEQTSLKDEMHREDGLLIYNVRIHIWYSLVVSFNLHKLIQVRKSGYNTKPLFNFLALMAIYLIMSQQIGNCIQMVLLPSFQQHHNSFINLLGKTSLENGLPFICTKQKGCICFSGQIFTELYNNIQ